MWSGHSCPLPLTLFLTLLLISFRDASTTVEQRRFSNKTASTTVEERRFNFQSVNDSG
jgi:hypothetical protein